MPTEAAVRPSLAVDPLLAALRWRYAVKAFDPGFKIDAETWSALEESLVLAPSSFGLQPWRFLVVDDPAVRAELRPASWNQAQITDASRLVVFAYKKSLSPADVRRYVERTAEVRGVAPATLAGFEQMMVGHLAKLGPAAADEWAKRQVYIALGQFLASAALLGIDACPMEGFDPAKYDERLGLARDGFGSVVLATAGRRAASDKYAAAKKVRFATREVVRHV
jgi:nitroreductase